MILGRLAAVAGSHHQATAASDKHQIAAREKDGIPSIMNQFQGVNDGR
ncbi:MAG: hypothetical protein ACPHL6_05870 [Rubripirellula sp.]